MPTLGHAYGAVFMQRDAGPPRPSRRRRRHRPADRLRLRTLPVAIARRWRRRPSRVAVPSGLDLPVGLDVDLEHR